MSKKFVLMIPVVLVAIALFSLSLPAGVLAHGNVEVGNYELVIGFHNEPAYQGEPNGLDLFVTNLETGKPVNGLAETLRAEVIFGSFIRELELRGQFGQEGAYTADVLPTEAGDYTWHIWGDIEGTPVDVSMTSGPGAFSAVQPKSMVSFPDAELSSTELMTQTAAAARSAQTALIVGVVGAILGLAGLIVGFLGFRAAKG